jgi:hypothetical protein
VTLKLCRGTLHRPLRRADHVHRRARPSDFEKFDLKSLHRHHGSRRAGIEVMKRCRQDEPVRVTAYGMTKLRRSASKARPKIRSAASPRSAASSRISK